MFIVRLLCHRGGFQHTLKFGSEAELADWLVRHRAVPGCPRWFAHSTWYVFLDEGPVSVYLITIPQKG